MSHESAARALSLALGYVGRRERTVAEVRLRLERAEVDASDVEAAVAELTELGLVDDSRYARLFVEDKRALEGWGGERIRRGLTQRGIDRELIEAALASESGPTANSELQRAVEVLQRRLRSPPRDRRERERAMGMLLRKGYEPELAAEAIAAFREPSAGSPAVG